MKSLGIVRKVDELGRIVIPIELRKSLDIKEKDSLEIFVDGSAIILQKYIATECQKCHKKIENEDKYCKHCGEKVED